MKTAELTGAALDWAVAKCEGFIERPVYGRGAVKFLRGLWKETALGGWDSWVFRHDFERVREECEGRIPTCNSTGIWQPSTDWSQGGPILDKHISELIDCVDDGWEACCNGTYGATGQTALEAVCKAYVASKLGDEVDVPKELT